MNDKTPHCKKSGPDARNTHSVEDLYLLYVCLSVRLGVIITVIWKATPHTVRPSSTLLMYSVALMQ